MQVMLGNFAKIKRATVCEQRANLFPPSAILCQFPASPILFDWEKIDNCTAVQLTK